MLKVKDYVKDLKGIYYITQYSVFENDADVYASINGWIIKNEIDVTVFSEILELMPKVDDSVNQKVFNYLLFLDNEKLEKILLLYEALEEADLNELDDLFNNNELYDWMADRNIYSPDTWEELADQDLKENGIDARCLYWVKDIDYNYEYQGLNGYENGFNDYTEEEVIKEFIDENLEDWLKDLVKDYGVFTP